MKVIRTHNQLKLVGKVWEIKYKLREFSQINITVKEYLNLFNVEN